MLPLHLVLDFIKKATWKVLSERVIISFCCHKKFCLTENTAGRKIKKIKNPSKLRPTIQHCFHFLFCSRYFFFFPEIFLPAVLPSLSIPSTTKYHHVVLDLKGRIKINSVMIKCQLKRHSHKTRLWLTAHGPTQDAPEHWNFHHLPPRARKGMALPERTVTFGWQKEFRHWDLWALSGSTVKKHNSYADTCIGNLYMENAGQMKASGIRTTGMCNYGILTLSMENILQAGTFFK